MTRPEKARRALATTLVALVALALIAPTPSVAAADGPRVQAGQAGQAREAREARQTGQTDRASRSKPPKVTSVSPATGEVTGGTAITIRGRQFVGVKWVKVGGVRATNVKVRSKSKLTAVTQPGLAGDAAVVVRTKAGASTVATAPRFTFTDPAPSDIAAYDPGVGTVLGTGVEWVTGGTDVDSASPGLPAPWVIGIGPSGQVPAVGDHYFLAPGHPVFPQGLAGTVSVVAGQGDTLTAITVLPTSLDLSLDEIQIGYSGPVVDPDPQTLAAPARDITDSTVSFPKLGSSSFLCTGQAGQSVSFGGSFSLSFENVQTNFDFYSGNLFSDPYLSAWVRYEPVLHGKVTGTAGIKCKLKPEWQNANRKIIPIGTSGATLSFAPAASFSLSSSGTIEFTQRSRRMVGLEVFNGDVDTIDVRKNLGLTVTGGKLETKVEADAGVSVQFGALDRIGIEGKATLNANAKISVKSPPLQSCVDAVFGVKLKLNAFLDVWVARWESPGYSHTWPFAEWHKCTTPIGAEDDAGDPVIASLRLPDGVRTKPYSAYLTTEDGRAGTWSIETARFPVGLFLDLDTGEVYGTPTAAVGDYAFRVTFTDTFGHSDTQLVRLYLSPPPPVGGGDIQATLTWASAADLDLYVDDPLGETVYYGSRTSSSGGYLDRDANAGCTEALSNPIENTYWPTATAPSGVYGVYVNVWSSCAVSDLAWHLTVRVGGTVVISQSGSGNSPYYEITVSGAAPRVAVKPLPRAVPRAPKG